MTPFRTRYALAALLAAQVLPTYAIEQPGHAHRHHATGPSAAGRPGQPAAVTRAIDIAMDDSMRFTPDQLVVDAGETVRLSVRNDGQVMHELVLGSADDIAEHRQAMLRNPATAHGSAAMVHVAPGKAGKLVWQFGEPGRYAIACLLPGHFEAGMRGEVLVR